MIELITLGYLDRDPNPVFCAAMGPFLGNVAAAREIGAEITSDPLKTWVVILHIGEPRGCAAVFLNNHNPDLPCEFSSAYVLPDWRGRGYYNALIEKRLELVGQARDIIVHARPQAAPALKRYGFVPDKQLSLLHPSETYESLRRPSKALRFDLR